MYKYIPVRFLTILARGACPVLLQGLDRFKKRIFAVKEKKLLRRLIQLVADKKPRKFSKTVMNEDWWRSRKISANSIVNRCISSRSIPRYVTFHTLCYVSYTLRYVANAMLRFIRYVTFETLCYVRFRCIEILRVQSRNVQFYYVQLRYSTYCSIQFSREQVTQQLPNVYSTVVKRVVTRS